MKEDSGETIGCKRPDGNRRTQVSPNLKKSRSGDSSMNFILSVGILDYRLLFFYVAAESFSIVVTYAQYVSRADHFESIWVLNGKFKGSTKLEKWT